MFNQKGSTTIIAIVSLIFVAMLLSAIEPFIINETGFATKTRDGLEAQCAAEVGLRRGSVFLTKLSTDDLKNKKWTSFTERICNYNVSDTQEAGLKALTRQFKLQVKENTTDYSKYPWNFDLMSIGEVHGITRTVLVPFYVGPGLKGVGAISKSFEVKDPASGLNADVTTQDQLDAGKFNTDPNKGQVYGSGNRTSGADISIPAYDYDFYKRKAKVLPAIQMNQNNLDSGMYYHDGDLNIDMDNVQLTGKPAIIFVDGNINITGGGLNCKDVYFIAKKDITFGSKIKSSPNLTNVVLLAEGNINAVNLGLVQPGILVTPGKIIGDTTFNLNTNPLQAQTLADSFNNIMLKFYGNSSSEAGVHLVAVYGDWRVK